MTPAEERAYLAGRRAFASELRNIVLREMGIEGNEDLAARNELEEARSYIESVFEDAGISPPGDLHLADVLRRHLLLEPIDHERRR